MTRISSYCMGDIRLNETDEKILEILHEGRNVPANVAEELDFTRQYIQQRLRRLEEHGYIQNIGRGVYEIITDPRNADTDEIAEGVDVEQLNRALHDIELHISRDEPEDVEDAVKRARDALD